METLKNIPEDEERVLIATGRYEGEDFEDAQLDTLLLVMPVSWKGTLTQFLDKLHHLHHEKREVMVYVVNYWELLLNWSMTKSNKINNLKV